MRKLSLAVMTGGIALSAAAMFAPAQKADAMVVYPWCAYYGGRDGGSATNCGFVTRAQCMATISGLGGFCDVNPWWEGPVPEAQPARPLRKPSRG